MTAKELKGLRLSEPMIELLLSTKPGEPARPGPVRAALMRRGLFYARGGCGRFGHLTWDGERARAALEPQEVKW